MTQINSHPAIAQLSAFVKEQQEYPVDDYHMSEKLIMWTKGKLIIALNSIAFLYIFFVIFVIMGFFIMIKQDMYKIQEEEVNSLNEKALNCLM